MNALLESTTGLVLRDPALLWLALLVPLALWVRHARSAPAIRFGPAMFLDEPLPTSWRSTFGRAPSAFQAVGLVLVVFCLARPVHRVELPRSAAGIDIVLCLDASSSMSANDLDPNRSRLDVATDAARRFVGERPDDRIALLRFARYPDVLCPLTLDHSALDAFLADFAAVEPDGPEDATGIGTAVARAAQVLRSSDAESKVVVLLTDGTENVATTEAPDEIGPLRAARLCEQFGIRVYTIVAGIGQRDADDRFVPLDTTQVRRLAEITRGAFYEARDAGSVDAVYATIDELETRPFDEPRFELRERFLPFLFAALGLLLAARALRSTVFEVLP